MGQGHIVPDTFDQSVVDRTVFIDIDEAYKMSRALASRGIFAGQSSGAYVLGAQQVAEDARAGRIVTILNDIGERYFSTSMWG
jgi:cysteine synthase